MTAAWTVFCKELLDALRDRRTLLAVVLSSVAIGPLVLVLLSALVADLEQRAERRELVVAGLGHAPTLVNFLHRQAFTLKPAPADYERQLQDRRLSDAVLVLRPDFETELARGEPPAVEVVYSSAHQRADSDAARVQRALQGFAQEQAVLRVALRGVAPALLQPLKVQERDLANPQTRAARFTGMIPFFVLMAVLYGALNAALDSTAGERERGSLEPLLMNPVPRGALVLGKWAAVAAVGLLIALLSCFSFLPGQWLLRSETLAAMFQFGPVEAVLFLAALAPLAAALAALMMAVAIRCKSFKEAQANNTVLVLVVSMLPLVLLMNPEGEAPWQRWVPALGQVLLMNRVLKGEAVGAADLVAPLVACAVLTALGLGFVARQLRGAALR
jgi:sodium transport system permease protein